MKAQIIYADKKGMCRKVALALEEYFKVPAYAVSDVKQVEASDLLILVGGGKLSGEDNAGLEPLVKNMKKKQVKDALLVSLQAYTEMTRFLNFEKEGIQNLVREFLAQKEIELLGECRCACHYGVIGIGRPTKTDIRNTIESVKKVIGREYIPMPEE